MLRYRLLVAVIGIPIGLAAVILGGYYLLGLALLLTVLGLHEYYTLLRPYEPNMLVGFVAGVATIIGSSGRSAANSAPTWSEGWRSPLSESCGSLWVSRTCSSSGSSSMGWP